MKLWIVVLVLVLIIAVPLAYFLIPEKRAAAILSVGEGTVEVNVGDGWNAAIDGMKLDREDYVRTGVDGKASVILLEGEIVNLEPLTEIFLDEVTDKTVLLSQSSGVTWNKVTRLSGITTFSVETPNTVATVRGTEFVVRVDGGEEVEVLKGKVEVFERATNKAVMVDANKRAVYDGGLRIEDIRPETLAKAAEILGYNIEGLKIARKTLLGRQRALRAAQKQYGTTEEEAEQFLDEIDAGERKVEDVIQYVPDALRGKDLDNAVALTREIQKLQERR